MVGTALRLGLVLWESHFRCSWEISTNGKLPSPLVTQWSVIAERRFVFSRRVSKLGTALPLTMLLNKYGRESLSCSFERVVSNLGTLWLTSLFIMDESALGGYKYGQSGGFIWSGSGSGLKL